MRKHECAERSSSQAKPDGCHFKTPESPPGSLCNGRDDADAALLMISGCSRPQTGGVQHAHTWPLLGLPHQQHYCAGDLLRRSAGGHVRVVLVQNQLPQDCRSLNIAAIAELSSCLSIENGSPLSVHTPVSSISDLQSICEFSLEHPQA